MLSASLCSCAWLILSYFVLPCPQRTWSTGQHYDVLENLRDWLLFLVGIYSYLSYSYLSLLWLFSLWVMSDSLWPHGVQCAKLPCLSVYPGVCSVSIELVVLSSHLILCCPLLLLPSVFLSIRIFSEQLPVHIRWLASASVLPVNIQGRVLLGLTGLISLRSKISQESSPTP